MQYRRLGHTDVQIPVIGQGTWRFGEDRSKAKAEIEALRFGLERGMSLIDTAEEYAKGGSERVVGEAIADVRKEVFLVTKVSAKNCSYSGVLQAAESSLDRLNATYIDLYLQHWPNEQIPVAETMAAMTELIDKGLVKYVGVSNFTPKLLAEAQRALGRHPLVCNQIAYHLADRHIEDAELPFCRENGITVMGYSPFGYAPRHFGKPGFPQAGTPERAVLDEIGKKYGKNAYQVALNWIVRQEGIVTIPKSANLDHIRDNLNALGWELEEEDLVRIEHTFPKK
ncbi:aldo/keto reductase [Paenibacillus hemerocallicola]|uniref:Aldo/keto reductase n=1 Tax=Paenibacillus hemerocallicola TaxID=1172614 RepID=A0A5C4T432_9BACL|nr:aldo/keto reductase [Paenibacillus hemerocallicola]TNJ63842.1 aldo/keto reductase [Paenibacillus hemerocallicola]